jgi:hypothetical protein
MKKKMLLFLIVSSANIFSEPIFYNEIRRNSEADLVYEFSLKNRCLILFISNYTNCQSLPWSLYLLRRENIDSATAASIAIKAAEEHSGGGGIEMVPIAARLMGDNKEHWMVYINPKDIFKDLERQDLCDEVVIRRYNAGNLFMPRVVQEEKYCPMPIRVIISKENGEVLFIGGLF